MIKVRDDRAHDAILVEFEGKVDCVQAERSILELKKILPGHRKGFKVLADFSSVETMDVEVEDEIKEAMRLFNARGVGEVIRVLPDPELAVGFNYIARFFYSPDVKLVNFTSREQARACLSESSTAR